MSRFSEYIGSQFGNPRGITGAVCCFLMNVINRAMYRETAALISTQPHRKILDIGYGNGYLLKCLDKALEPELYGIDISPDMRAAAAKRNRKAAAAGRLHLETGDCCSLPYADQMFSAVSSINTIYFWSDPVKGLSEIRRVLLPGGCLYNAVYSRQWLDKLSYTRKGFQKYDPNELIRFGKQAGFEHIEVKPIVKGKSFLVIYRK